MTAHLWLTALPPSDPAFSTLQWAEQMSDPADFPMLAHGHRQAVLQAAFGKDREQLEAEATRLLEVAAREAKRDTDGTDADGVHAAELEALGFALGMTAALFAIRVHDQAQQFRFEVAS